MTGKNGESIELLEKTRTEEGKAEEQKIPPLLLKLYPSAKDTLFLKMVYFSIHLRMCNTIEQDTEQEGVSSDDIVGTPSQPGWFIGK